LTSRLAYADQNAKRLGSTRQVPKM
jgi:hypothetical protein